MQYLEICIEYFMDSLEEFNDAVKFPTASYTFQAFIVSLVFTCIAIILNILGIYSFIQWGESLMCNLLLFIVSIVDSSTRSSTMKFVHKTTSEAKSKIKVGSAIISSKINNYRGEEEDYYDDLEYETEYNEGDDSEEDEEYYGEDYEEEEYDDEYYSDSEEQEYVDEFEGEEKFDDLG